MTDDDDALTGARGHEIEQAWVDAVLSWSRGQKMDAVRGVLRVCAAETDRPPDVPPHGMWVSLRSTVAAIAIGAHMTRRGLAILKGDGVPYDDAASRDAVNKRADPDIAVTGHVVLDLLAAAGTSQTLGGYLPRLIKWCVKLRGQAQQVAVTQLVVELLDALTDLTTGAAAKWPDRDPWQTLFNRQPTELST